MDGEDVEAIWFKVELTNFVEPLDGLVCLMEKFKDSRQQVLDDIVGGATCIDVRYQPLPSEAGMEYFEVIFKVSMSNYLKAKLITPWMVERLCREMVDYTMYAVTILYARSSIESEWTRWSEWDYSMPLYEHPNVEKELYKVHHY